MFFFISIKSRKIYPLFFLRLKLINGRNLISVALLLIYMVWGRSEHKLNSI